MSELTATTPVGQWVTEHPRTARVLEELQIDYCCGGGRSLQQACTVRQLDPEAVVSQLRRVIAADADDPTSATPDWEHRPLAELCDHIEQTHHAYLKSELPRLTQLVQRVVDAHGAHHPELHCLQGVVARLRAELEPHMFKEERILFPAIRLLERTKEQPQFPFGSIANPIRMMEHEHDQSGNALREIRGLTGDFLVPEHACNTWRVMLDGLHHLESDLHQHIHKENNILFPRARARCA